MSQRTLTIIKPDSVENGNIGNIIAHLEREGFRIVAARSLRLTQAQAGAFYAVHRERPFYGSLVAYMTSGPVWVICLERADAVRHLRAVMGATNPSDAAEGTIRAAYGTSIERNAIHGSDSAENAAIEVGFFFAASELV
jgi:nucleoside-diphosphate kinase